MKTTIKNAGIRILIGSALLFVFIFTSGCMNTNNPVYTQTSNTKTTQGANEVYIQGMAFTPAILTVSSGTTVTWNNNDAMTHTVTSDSTFFDSGNILANGTFSYTFNTVGTFSYHCKIHPSMTAKVVVTAYVSSGY